MTSNLQVNEWEAFLYKVYIIGVNKWSFAVMDKYLQRLPSWIIE